MKRLSPHDIIRNNSYVGHHPRDVMVMAEHYGFTRTNSGGKHLLFTHNDYTDLTFALQKDSSHVGWQYVESAVKACMEVKRRNALRKEPVFQSIPAWAWKALPEGSYEKKSDNTVMYKVDDASERQYILRMRDGKLIIRNLDYPEQDYHCTFSVRDGSANIPGLTVVFNQLDAQVVQHAADITVRFHDELSRLIHHHGYLCSAYETKDGTEHLVLKHPVFTETLDIAAPQEGKAIPDTSFKRLHELLELSRERVLAQMEQVEELLKDGWRADHHPANGSAAMMRLQGPQGQRVEVPTYGMNILFDDALLRRLTHEGTVMPYPSQEMSEHEQPVTDTSEPPAPTNDSSETSTLPAEPAAIEQPPEISEAPAPKYRIVAVPRYHPTFTRQETPVQVPFAAAPPPPLPGLKVQAPAERNGAVESEPARPVKDELWRHRM